MAFIIAAGHCTVQKRQSQLEIKTKLLGLNSNWSHRSMILSRALNRPLDRLVDASNRYEVTKTDANSQNIRRAALPFAQNQVQLKSARRSEGRSRLHGSRKLKDSKDAIYWGTLLTLNVFVH